jgi:hypothetical protein
MPLAGETIIAGKVPGERIETQVRTSDSSGVTTTETAVDTVTAAVVAGRVYRIRYVMRVNSDAANDDYRVTIREDSASGTQLMLVNLDIPILFREPQTVLEAEYTADATEDKTFVGTIDRIAGSGTLIAVASAVSPTYLYVDYIRDA